MVFNIHASDVDNLCRRRLQARKQCQWARWWVSNNYLVSFLFILSRLYTHTRLTALFSILPGWASTRKVKPIWILLKQARYSELQWHQVGHMQVCTSLQTDNHATTPPLSFLQARCPSCRPTNSVEALKKLSTNWTTGKQIRHLLSFWNTSKQWCQKAVVTGHINSYNKGSQKL